MKRTLTLLTLLLALLALLVLPAAAADLPGWWTTQTC